MQQQKGPDFIYRPGQAVTHNKLSRHTSRTRVRGDTRGCPEADRRRYQATMVGVVLRGGKTTTASPGTAGRVSLQCTREDDGTQCSWHNCSFFFLVLIVIFVSYAYRQQTDTALRGLSEPLNQSASATRPPPVTVHPRGGNRQDDSARRVYQPPCVNTQVALVSPLRMTTITPERANKTKHEKKKKKYIYIYIYIYIGKQKTEKKR